MGAVKPWEETWRVEHLVVCNDEGRFAFGSGAPAFRSEEEDALEKATLQLAACAPEMARMLLELEWSGEELHYGETRGGACPSCCGVGPRNVMHRVEDGVIREPGRHEPSCELDTLLRKAGVR